MKNYRIGDSVVIGRKINPEGECVSYAEIVGVNTLQSFKGNRMFKVKDSLSRISEISEQKLNELRN